MAHVWADRVRETATTTGTGNFTLAGAVSACQAFSGVCATGDTLFYCIAHQSANEWEVGFGTYSAANTLTRTRVLASSNSGSAVNFSAGTKDVFLTENVKQIEAISNPNIVINGDFQINQRVFAGGALSADVYGFDRWKAATGGADVSVSGYTVTLTSGAIEQVIVPSLWGYASFASQSVTISVDTPSKDLGITFGSQSGTITAGSGRRSVTLTLGGGDTGNLTLQIDRSADDGVTFGRVKLEIGATATAWQARPLSEEVQLCQRYYWKSYGLSTAPGTVTNDGSFSITSANTVVNSVVFPVRHPVVMRAAPKVTVYNPGTGGTGTMRRGTTNVDANAELITDQGFRVVNSAVTTDGSGHFFHVVCDAEL